MVIDGINKWMSSRKQGELREEAPDSAWMWRMSRLTRDGTTEPVSRDLTLRHERGQEKTIFPVQLTMSRIGNLTRLIHTLLCTR